MMNMRRSGVDEVWREGLPKENYGKKEQKEFLDNTVSVLVPQPCTAGNKGGREQLYMLTISQIHHAPFCKLLCEHLQCIVAINAAHPAKFHQSIVATSLGHQLFGHTLVLPLPH